MALLKLFGKAVPDLLGARNCSENLKREIVCVLMFVHILYNEMEYLSDFPVLFLVLH